MLVRLFICSCLLMYVTCADPPKKIVVKIPSLQYHSSRTEAAHYVSVQLGSEALRVPYKPFCSGVYLNEKWVLTAAQCVHALPTNFSLAVVAPKINKNRKVGENLNSVYLTFVHPDYKGMISTNDIALLKLTDKLELDVDVAPIELPELDEDVIGPVKLFGYAENDLRTIELRSIQYIECFHVVGSTLDKKSNICAVALSNDYPACLADAGSSLISTSSGVKKLVGIGSWGVFPCNIHGVPAVFTRVSSFIGWIRENMKNHQ